MGASLMTRRRSVATPVLLLMAVTLVGSCGDDDGNDPNGALVFGTVVGNNQVGVPGQALPQGIAIQVLQGSNPAPAGVEVEFSTADGTITESSLTDGSGVATASWILPGGTDVEIYDAEVQIVGGQQRALTAFAVPADHGVITVQDDVFTPGQPNALTIGVGETVTWVWLDGAIGHNVSPLGTEPVQSGNLTDGPFTYSYAFNSSGNYVFYCEAHGTPGGTGMAGTVLVEP